MQKRKNISLMQVADLNNLVFFLVKSFRQKQSWENIQMRDRICTLEIGDWSVKTTALPQVTGTFLTQTCIYEKLKE